MFLTDRPRSENKAMFQKHLNPERVTCILFCSFNKEKKCKIKCSSRKHTFQYLQHKQHKRVSKTDKNHTRKTMLASTKQQPLLKSNDIKP